MGLSKSLSTIAGLYEAIYVRRGNGREAAAVSHQEAISHCAVRSGCMYDNGALREGFRQRLLANVQTGKFHLLLRSASYPSRSPLSSLSRPNDDVASLQMQCVSIEGDKAEYKWQEASSRKLQSEPLSLVLLVELLIDRVELGVCAWLNRLPRMRVALSKRRKLALLSCRCCGCRPSGL